MNLLQTTLEQAGLSSREAALYMALLELGPATVLAMARKAEMKRPTAYLVLEELLQKGLVSRVPKEKKKLFMALSPTHLIDTLDKRTSTLRTAMPQLLAFYRGQSEKPLVQIFESKEGMLNVYRDITSDKSIGELLSFVSPEMVPEDFDENWEMFIKLFSEKRVKGREIITAQSKNHPYIKKTRKLYNYEARYATEGLNFFSDTVMYGNKIAIFSFKKGFALIIESDDVSKSFRSLFELAWASSHKA